MVESGEYPRDRLDRHGKSGDLGGGGENTPVLVLSLTPVIFHHFAFEFPPLVKCSI